jgi:hypothetical protein
MHDDPETRRLIEAREQHVPWKQWGPYLSERQWGTVREDYSTDGSAWNYFTHDQARSRAYGWGEDGGDERQLLPSPRSRGLFRRDVRHSWRLSAGPAGPGVGEGREPEHRERGVLAIPWSVQLRASNGMCWESLNGRSKQNGQIDFNHGSPSGAFLD